MYKEVRQEVACTLRTSAYTYQFLCKTADTEIVLEKDDEGKLRARESEPFSNKNRKPDPEFIRALVEEMERVLQ